MAMLNFLLRSLKYPRLEGFNADDPAHFQAAVVWLENTKVRQYPIDGRAALQSPDPAAWQAALTKYLADLECPLRPEAGNHRAVLQWLASHAGELACCGLCTSGWAGLAGVGCNFHTRHEVRTGSGGVDRSCLLRLEPLTASDACMRHACMHMRLCDQRRPQEARAGRADDSSQSTGAVLQPAPGRCCRTCAGRAGGRLGHSGEGGCLVQHGGGCGAAAGCWQAGAGRWCCERWAVVGSFGLRQTGGDPAGAVIM